MLHGSFLIVLGACSFIAPASPYAFHPHQQQNKVFRSPTTTTTTRTATATTSFTHAEGRHWHQTIGIPTSPSRTSSSTRLHVKYGSGYGSDHDSSADDGDGSDDALAQRMANIRALQKAFYSPDASFENAHFDDIDDGSSNSMNKKKNAKTTNRSPYLDEMTGILHNIPIWDIELEDETWTPVPGRSHVLSLSSAMNTHLLETIVRNDDIDKSSWYVGHLPTPSSSSSSSSTSDTHQTLGSLLRISDYRRMMDGQILVLVHVLDRFVVDATIKERPYPIVNIQLIPDLEELDPYLTQEYLAKESESTISCARAMAICESFSYYQAYEYDLHHTLPLPCGDDNNNNNYNKNVNSNNNANSNQVNLVLNATDMMMTPTTTTTTTTTETKSKDSSSSIIEECYLEEDDLSSKMDRVLPFSPYAKNVQPPTSDQVSAMMIENGEFEDCDILDDDDDDDDASATSARRRPLEWQLLQSKVLKTPKSVSSSWAATGLSTQELEVELWLAMNDYLGKTRTPVSPILLGLIPPNIHWPSTFRLNAIGRGLANLESLLARGNRVSKNGVSTQAVATNTTTATEQAPTSTKSASTKNSATTSPTKPTRKITHDYVALSRDYPDYRRQKRLSYSAAQLLETAMPSATEQEQLRQQLLQIPATKHRLAFALDGFHSLLASSSDNRP